MADIGTMKDVYTVAKYVRISGEAIARFVGALESAGYDLRRKEDTDKVKVAEMVCGIYFGIAEEVVGAEEVRRLFKERFDKKIADVASGG